MERLQDEIVKRLAEQARKYNDDERQRFVDEVGWEDWMEDFVDGEEITEKESSAIDDILTQIFESVRQD